ncbi:branched-chain amino acid transaminase [Nocardiopsis sp. B62]|uniref:branched-chain amino acid transaminase n=1 Tax=Nocardiopsis sp. B62 TaxID=2824874 RepID=UPI001B358565|nr:branched-chain amino acid transaminase [Nocardiopsis sp. B62]MBQ1082403.1 branched-chain amino acid transaminase [Nocardiopsis sp. B62]
MDVTTEAVWMDGEIVSGPEAMVHVMTPSLHYGWGAYEGIRFYTSDDPERPGPLIFRLAEHLSRLEASSEALGMSLPHSQEELIAACVQLVRRSGLSEGYLRPLVMLRAGAMSVAGQIDDVSVVIGCWTWSGYVSDADSGISVRTSSWVRCAASQIPPSVKSTGGYLNPSLARLDAVRGGDHEAILLNQEGRVAEASAANVFAVIDDTLVTPPLSEGILPGITRDAVLTLAEDHGMPTLCRPVEPRELSGAEEVMLAGTAMELAPVVRIDGSPVGQGRPGPWYAKLRGALDGAFHGRCEDHQDWSTDCSPDAPAPSPLTSGSTASGS